MKNHAFTLIELLVVVLIIGILAAIALPQYQKAVDKARVQAMFPIMRYVREQEKMYKLANGTYTLSWEELGTDIPYQSISQDKRTITVNDNLSYFLSASSGSRDYFMFGIDKVVNIYLSFGGNTMDWLCYPKDTARGRNLCKSLGCTNADAVNCRFNPN